MVLPIKPPPNLPMGCPGCLCVRIYIADSRDRWWKIRGCPIHDEALKQAKAAKRKERMEKDE